MIENTLRKIAKGILKLQGYKIVIIRVQNGHTHIDGDKELLKYTDITGFLYNKEPYIQRPYKAKMVATKINEPVYMGLPIPPSINTVDDESLISLNPHGNSIVSEWDNYNAKGEEEEEPLTTGCGCNANGPCKEYIDTNSVIKQ